MSLPKWSILPLDKETIIKSMSYHCLHSLGKETSDLNERTALFALTLSVRDRLVERMHATSARFRDNKCKRAYYLSIEYLPGKNLERNLRILEIYDLCKSVFRELGLDMDKALEFGRDPALGNGGLGRLAACYIDSMASLDYPAYGYGIHYEFGLFKQVIENGYQKETADYWMANATPIQLERRDLACQVPVYGRVEAAYDDDGQYNPMWLDWEDLMGVPFDIPISGYLGKTVNRLRLYSARATSEFNMEIFNQGDYLHAIQNKIYSEIVSKLLYPNESISFGREMRLVQEYFLVACSLRDIMRRFKFDHGNINEFSDKVAIQLNDTHPALAVAELMRMLVDENNVTWEKAWEITKSTFAYTNHTLMPEALETWPVHMFETILPRHLQIIYEINRRFLEKIEIDNPGDMGKLQRMSLIEESGEKKVRMANLAVVGSHSVNGVSALHSELVKTNLFPDFMHDEPKKFKSITNGITQRRWLLCANPRLASLITDYIGKSWITDLHELKKLESFVDNSEFQEKFMAVKKANKTDLADFVLKTQGIELFPDSLFDVQTKRIHEYKRQLLNVLRIIREYFQLVRKNKPPLVPKTYVFSGKAAPGYWEAKNIIKLIHNVARMINNDPATYNMLKVVFIPDYKVTKAQMIIPAADLSEQISTAGTEASGTGNMKFALNGALTIGTLDGANIEIKEEVGDENIYIFGLTTAEIRKKNEERSYNPWEYYSAYPEIREVLESLRDDYFCTNEPGLFKWIFDKLMSFGEKYFHLADFTDYVDMHEKIAMDYADREKWVRKSILNTARMGKFSSDRAIGEYAADIWNITPVGPQEEPPIKEKKTRSRKK